MRPQHRADVAFETVAEEVFRRYARNWKPSTLKVNRGLLQEPDPALVRRAVPIADIAASDVKRNGSPPFTGHRWRPTVRLRCSRSIMSQAEVYGYRPEGTNPCAGIKRYRRQGRERFLSAAEMRRLGEVLTRHEADNPQAVAIVRLLLLTGCRRGEIVSLKWRDYREGQAVPAR